MEKRACGVLLHISSLPSRYGIGSIGRQAYSFIDFLKESGQSYWQMLPTGPTGYGDSPYQSLSTFAGNPYLIDLDLLYEEGFLRRSDLSDIKYKSGRVAYDKLYLERHETLYKAYLRFASMTDRAAFDDFCTENSHWLSDFSLFMAIKEHYKGMPWQEWETDIRLRSAPAMSKFRSSLEDRINYHSFVQYIFFRQWDRLKTYAEDSGIKLIGDMPIYVAMDSADAWANPEILLMTETCTPISVAGCPPDYFSATGQLWGNPVYDWDYLRQENYLWWIRRLNASRKLYDVLRIDHFRAFDEYYAIPYGDKTAEKGRWMPGPRMDFFHAVRSSMGDFPIIAEDLGFMTDGVRSLLAESGYPGLKVLLFGFDDGVNSEHLPHNYIKNSVAYTGTHDNDTVLGWAKNASSQSLELACRYLGAAKVKELPWAFIRAAMASVADLVIIPMQDILALDNSARMNHPSTLGGNWSWAMSESSIDSSLVRDLRVLTETYGRL